MIHTNPIIICSGLGDTAAGWYPLARSLAAKPAFSHIRFVLPTAPSHPVTLNGGMPMPSWFDIKSLTPGGPEPEDEKGLLASVATIQGLIGKETDAGIPANRIVVGGFSQGVYLMRSMPSVALLTSLSLSTLPSLRRSSLPVRCPLPRLITHHTLGPCTLPPRCLLQEPSSPSSPAPPRSSSSAGSSPSPASSPSPTRSSRCRWIMRPSTLSSGDTELVIRSSGELFV